MDWGLLVVLYQSTDFRLFVYKRDPAFADKLKDAVEDLLDNCYIKVGDSLFRQIIGIPMGSDPALYIANLFLYYFERKC